MRTLFDLHVSISRRRFADSSGFVLTVNGVVKNATELAGCSDCAFTGETFLVQGGSVTLVESWQRGQGVERDSKWTVGELAEALAPLAPQ